jgi:hypothetical protein
MSRVRDHPNLPRVTWVWGLVQVNRYPRRFARSR